MLMCRQNKVSPPISPSPQGGGEALKLGGRPYPQRSVPLVVRARSYPRASCSPSHGYKAAQSPSTTSDGDENSNIDAAFGTERLPRFPSVLRWEGGPHNPVTGPGETSEASLPSSTNMAVTAFPNTGTLVQPMQYSHFGSNVPLPGARNVRSVGGRYGDLYTVWDRPIVPPHHHHIFRPIADLRFRPARAPRNRVAEFSANAQPQRCD